VRVGLSRRHRAPATSGRGEDDAALSAAMPTKMFVCKWCVGSKDAGGHKPGCEAAHVPLVTWEAMGGKHFEPRGGSRPVTCLACGKSRAECTCEERP